LLAEAETRIASTKYLPQALVEVVQEIAQVLIGTRPQEAVDLQYKYLATVHTTTLLLQEEVAVVVLRVYRETAFWLEVVAEVAFLVPTRLVESTTAEVLAALNHMEAQGAPLVWLDLLLV